MICCPPSMTHRSPAASKPILSGFTNGTVEFPWRLIITLGFTRLPALSDANSPRVSSRAGAGRLSLIPLKTAQKFWCPSKAIEIGAK